MISVYLSCLPDVAGGLILETPLWLESISGHASLHHPLSVVNHPRLGLLPASAGVSPQPLT